MKINRTIYACLALLTAYTGAAAQTAITEETFPDKAFRAYVAAVVDKDSDGVLSDDEISSTRSIDLHDSPESTAKVESLMGIETFSGLRVLNCAGNSLSALDLRANKELEQVYCNGNNIESLKTDGLTQLVRLNCAKNRLTALDLSDNDKLKSLDCSNNMLTAIDVSNSTELNTLICKKNALSAIDVTRNTALKQLSCSANPIATLDISNNTELTHLACAGNSLTALDLSHNKELIEIDCHDNQIGSLDVLDCANLTELYCFGNKISTLDVSKNKALVTLSCGTNELEDLNVRNNTEMKNLSCGVNKLKDLDTSNNEALEVLNCNGNEIEQLDLSENTRLAELRCEDNEMTVVNLSSNRLLETATTDIQMVERELITLPSGNNGIALADEAEEEAISNISIDGTELTGEAKIETFDGQKYLVVDIKEQQETDDIELSYQYATGNATAQQTTGNRSLRINFGSTWDGVDEDDALPSTIGTLGNTDEELKVRVVVNIKKTAKSTQNYISSEALTVQQREEKKLGGAEWSNVRIKVVDHHIVVSGADDYILYDIIGRQMNPNALLERGVYVVRIGDKAERVRVK